MTDRQHPEGPDGPVDLSEVAAEPPGESVAREAEIIEEIAHEDGWAERPAHDSVDEQLAALPDPDDLRDGRDE
jgi:hypothetical protein